MGVGNRVMVVVAAVEEQPAWLDLRGACWAAGSRVGTARARDTRSMEGARAGIIAVASSNTLDMGVAGEEG